MAQSLRNEFLPFSFDKHQLYKLNGAEWRFAYQTNGLATFSAIEDPHKKVTFELATLNRMNGAGQIEVVPLFTSVCLELGFTKVQTIAGRPSTRGKIERFFHNPPARP